MTCNTSAAAFSCFAASSHSARALSSRRCYSALARRSSATSSSSVAVICVSHRAARDRMIRLPVFILRQKVAWLDHPPAGSIKGNRVLVARHGACPLPNLR